MVCEHCEAKYNKEVKAQTKVAKDYGWAGARNVKMDTWRFNNNRPRLERHMLRCDACEVAHMDEQFEFQNRQDEMRGVFLRCLQDHDAEAVAYIKMIRDDKEQGTYKSPLEFTDVCPVIYKTLEDMNEEQWFICNTMASLGQSLIELDMA